MVLVGSLSARTVLSGELVTNNLPEGGMDEFTFTAEAGDGIILSVGDAGGNYFDPMVKLYSPAGELLDSGWGSLRAYISHRATQSGTFKAVVMEGYNGDAGTYRFTMVRAPAEQHDPGGRVVQSGELVSQTLPEGDVDVFTFTAEAGDGIIVSAGDAGGDYFDPMVKLYSPAGELLDSGWGSLRAYINHRATLSGVYTAVVMEGYTGEAGTYRFTMVRAPATQNDLSGGFIQSGQVINRTLPEGDMDVFTFTAAAGDDIGVAVDDADGTYFYPMVKLYSPAGELLDSKWGSQRASISHRATQRGIYTAVVMEGYNGDAGAYNITLTGASSLQVFMSRVVDPTGTPIADATVTIKRYGDIFFRGSTDANGYFPVPRLDDIHYTVIISHSEFVTSVTNINGIHALQIALTPLVVAPTVVATDETIPATAVRKAPSGPVSDHLRVFDGSLFVSDTSSIDPNRMTVVISHGWNTDLADKDVWAKSLALQIINNHGLAAQPNIIGWDWGEEAKGLTPTVDQACEQGIAFGKALHQILGIDYGQHVHFIGHSLGTVVNAYACDYVHGSFNRSSLNPAIAWSAYSTTPHITLLDEAEIASVFGQNVTTAAKLGWKAAKLKGAIIAGGVSAVANWRSPIPKNATWIDNYISAVGVKHDEAVNVSLVAPLVSLQGTSMGAIPNAVISAHGYSHLFYRNTVNPVGLPSSMGFGMSIESGASDLPSGVGYTPGSSWYENIDTGDSVDLTLTLPDLGGTVNSGLFTGSMPIIHALLLTGGDQISSFYKTKIDWVGEIGGSVIHTTGNVITSSTQKLGLFWDAAEDKAADVLNSVDPSMLITGPLGASVFQIRLITQPPSVGAMQASASDRGIAPMAVEEDADPTARFTINVPADAAFIAFDFTVTGDPVNDRLACAINGQNVFTIPAAFAPDDKTVSTDLINVVAHAGQNVEMFFGLVGGSSSDCEVTIDGLRFITLPKPSVILSRDQVGLSAQWPASATGWALQQSSTLAPGSWLDIPEDTGISVKQGVSKLPLNTQEGQMFYRLRKKE